MIKIKVIDLLNKIANGEEVPRYIHNGGVKYVYENGGEYVNIPTGDLLFDFPDDRQLKDYLNDEMEIIKEDKKIEKCKVNFNTTLPNKATENEAFMMTCINWVADKVDEIIDHINNGADE